MRHRCADVYPKNAYSLPPVPDEEQFTLTQSSQEQQWEQEIMAAREKLRMTQNGKIAVPIFYFCLFFTIYSLGFFIIYNF
jgi:hypothetical protein